MSVVCSSSPRHFQLQRLLKWRNIRLGIALFSSCWITYMLCLMLTTHPCLHSTKCFTSLLLGTHPHASFSSHSLHRFPSAHECLLQTTDSKKSKTSLPNLLFGIASSADNWPKRKHYVELWWKPQVMRGFVWLDRKIGEEPQTKTVPPLKVSEDTSTYKYSFCKGLRSAIRIARIVSESFRMNLSDVDWFVMGDDDTVFFPENLVQVLSKYDKDEYVYIGGVSESVDQNAAHSFSMGFGGAGFAISYPLAKALEKMQDKCLDHYSYLYGSDERVHACLTELGVPLTREDGFHQVDLRGNIVGWLSAHPQTPLVSLHHLDALKPIFPNLNQTEAFKLLFKAVEADSSRVLQQSICYDTSLKRTLSVSWGYSIHLYDNIRLTRELENPQQTFTFWRKSRTDQFMFNTKNVSRNPCDRPSVFFLKNVNIGFSSISTIYRIESYAGCQSRQNRITIPQEIVVESPKTPLNWKQSPRRQCCDVLASANSSYVLHIRRCLDGEVIYPL